MLGLPRDLWKAQCLCGLARFGAWTALYFLLDRILNATFSDGWTILWPLNGLTLGLLLKRRRREWPLLLAAVAIGTGLGEIYINTLGSEIAQRLLSVMEVTVSALILPRFNNLGEWLREPHLHRKFFISLVLGPGSSGVLAALLLHLLNGESYLGGFRDWAVADGLGMAATLPLALTARSSEMRELFAGTAWRRTVPLLSAVAGVSVLVFMKVPFPILFLVYPTLLLADWMLGFAGSAIAVPLVCLIGVYAVTEALGPFAAPPATLHIPTGLALQIFLAFQSLALFPASMQFRERRLLEGALRQKNAQLTELASIDGLTRIPNRRCLDDCLATEWRRAVRQQTPLGLLMVDIDHFKQYNDRYGHQAGDDCLRAVAAVLPLHCRRPHDLAGRFGGEEFLIVLPETQERGILFIAARICLAVRALQIAHGDSSWGQVTVSVGCAVQVPDTGSNPQTLLAAADAALYAAKRGGRNTLRIAPDRLPARSSAADTADWAERATG